MAHARTVQLLDGVTTVSSSTTHNPDRVNGRALAQVKIVSGTATVICQGRADANAPWASLAVLTESDMGFNDTAIVDVPCMPHMRMTVANVSGSTTDGWYCFE